MRRRGFITLLGGTMAASLLLFTLGSVALACGNNGQWGDFPANIRQWFQSLTQPDDPSLRRSGRLRGRHVRGRGRPLRRHYHRRQGGDSERHAHPGAQPKDEVGRWQSHRARHHLHRAAETGVLLRDAWRAVIRSSCNCGAFAEWVRLLRNTGRATTAPADSRRGRV
jgi:hypothetical protein